METVPIDTLCRICLRVSKTLKPLFADRNSFADRINDCFNFDFKITESEYHPNHICFNCLADLFHAFKFFENARSSEHQLSMQIFVDKSIVKQEPDNVMDDSEELDLVEKKHEIESTGRQTDDENVLLMEVVLKNEVSDAQEDAVNDEYLYEEHLSDEDAITLEESGEDEQVTIVEVQEPLDSRSVKENKPTQRKSKKKGSSETRTFICDICSKVYDKKTSYVYHMKTKHIKFDDRAFECSVCFKKFALKADYIRHSRIHTNEKRFICSYCGKKFTDRSTHLKHERVHSGVKPYQCDQCLKSFSYKFVLSNHYLIHTGEKNFPCPEPDCGKRFSRKSKMKDHFVRIHKKQFTQEQEDRSLIIQQGYINAIKKEVFASDSNQGGEDDEAVISLNMDREVNDRY